jgi:hypothetical protein
VVHLAGVAGLDDERDAGAQALADEVVVQAGDASSDGIGAYSLVTPRSERMMTLTSSSSIMRRAIMESSSMDLARPFSPRETRKRMGSTPVLRPGRLVRRILANSSFVRTGHFSSTRRQAVGCGLSRLPSEPSRVSCEMTISSRIESIGGLVTWAKSCLK